MKFLPSSPTTITRFIFLRMDAAAMGAPISTPSFDAYFTMGARGDTAYFSSADESTEQGYGKSDIWKLGLRAEQRPGFNMPDGEAFNPNLSAKDLQGSLFRLDNVLFDVGKSSIKSESRA